jgi:hypothetical protein
MQKKVKAISFLDESSIGISSFNNTTTHNFLRNTVTITLILCSYRSSTVFMPLTPRSGGGTAFKAGLSTLGRCRGDERLLAYKCNCSDLPRFLGGI